MPRVRTNTVTREELIETISGCSTKQELQIRLTELAQGQNKDYYRVLAGYVKEEFYPVPPEFRHEQITKGKGKDKEVVVTHYAERVLYDLRKIAASKYKDGDVLDNVIRSQNNAVIPVDVELMLDAARSLIREDNWAAKLIGVCLLTGRRLGGVAYESLFSVVTPSVMKVVSGQKKFGKTSIVFIPVLDNAQVIYDAIQSLRQKVKTLRHYDQWSLDKCADNSKKLTTDITNQGEFRNIYAEMMQPLFNGHESSSIHGLRGVYGSLIAALHKMTHGSSNTSYMMQYVLDHESLVTTAIYEKFELKNVDKVLESFGNEFIDSLDANHLKSLNVLHDSRLPFDFTELLDLIADEPLRNEIGGFLADPGSLTENLAGLLNRLVSIRRSDVAEIEAVAKKSFSFSSKADEIGSALQSRKRNELAEETSDDIYFDPLERAKLIVKSAMIYNDLQASTNQQFICITGAIVDKVSVQLWDCRVTSGKLVSVIGGKIKGDIVKGMMEDELKTHHENYGILENHNLYYRTKTGKMEEIITQISSIVNEQIQNTKL